MLLSCQNLCHCHYTIQKHVTLTFILAGLISIYGSVAESETPNDVGSNLVLCRTVRNARKSIQEKVRDVFSNPEFVTECVISDACTSLFCSTNSKGQDGKFGWNLNLCDGYGSHIDFVLNSVSVADSIWSYKVSPRPTAQRIKVPLLKSGLVDYYLNTTFLRWLNPQHVSDEKSSRLSLDVSLDICNGTCKSFNILSGIQFPLNVLCDQPESIAANLLRNVPTEVQVPASITSHVGMPCTLNNPFACGVNSVCRHHEGGKSDEGICDCCDRCKVGKDGSCISRKRTMSEVPPSHEAHLAADENCNTSVTTGFGAFFAIFGLLLLGGGIFYGIKYNYFSRVRNYLRNYWASRCGRPRRVISVADQGNIFNPMYDDDEPPLL